MPMSHVRALSLASCLVHAGCCEQSRENAEAFLRDPANQRCEVDADCVAVSTRCNELEGSLCHRVAMSREAASSSEWAEIERELGACQVGKCTTCAAALEPACNAGLCSRP